MNDVNTAGADSSAAPTETPETTLAIPTDEAQHLAWRKTGKLPEPKTADPAPASGAERKPAEAPAPASEAGKDSPEPKPGKAEQRKHELNEEIRELLRQRDTLRKEAVDGGKKDVKAAEPSPAPPARTAPVKPTRPKQKDFADWDAFEAAQDKFDTELDKWTEENSRYQAERLFAEADQRRVQEAQAHVFAERYAEAKARYPDLDEKINPVVQTLMGEQGKAIHPGVHAALSNSERLADVLYVLSGDPQRLTHFLHNAQHNYLAAIKEVAVLEYLVGEELKGGKGKAAAASATAVPERDASGKFLPADKPKVSEKTISDAPPPTREVGGRGTPPADEVESAAQREDPAAYFAAANRRDLAKRKG